MKKTLFLSVIFGLISFFLIYGCSITIPDGKEYIILRNAKIIPEVITEKGSTITVEYDSTMYLEDNRDIRMCYLLELKGLTKKPLIVGNELILCMDLTIENGKIVFPISSELILEGEKGVYKWPYVGNTTISFYLTDKKKKERISNILRIPITFE
jgi:hypothetical protein